MYPHKKKEVVIPYVHQDFPKWKYHESKAAKIVRDNDEEKDLGNSWKDSPAFIEAKSDDQPASVEKNEKPKGRPGRPKKEL